MSKRIQLTHLTFLGAEREKASIEFGSSLTVIHGASDTGKSYVVEAIDYMLGANTLKTIPEEAGYTHILLGLTLDGGRSITLLRTPSGGDISLYRRDLRDIPAGPPDQVLGRRHSAANERNISRFLLREIGLDGTRIQEKKSSVRDLRFRDLCHFFLVDETQMHAKRSPVLHSGQYPSQVAEKSTFRVLLSGRDDAGLDQTLTEVEKSVSKGKLELLDSIIESMGGQLESDDAEQLRDQLQRLESSVREATSSVDDVLSRRGRLVDARHRISRESSEQQNRVDEVSELLARFNLLKKQYDSDLARLEMVREAGSLLGFFDQGACVFCGASPEHQQANHVLVETTSIEIAVSVELEKTNRLRDDLLVTIDDLRDQLMEVEQKLRKSRSLIVETDSQIAALDVGLTPLRGGLDGLLAARSNAERKLSLFAQIEELRARRMGLAERVIQNSKSATPSIDARTIAEFIEVMQQSLHAWNVPDVEHISYSEGKAEFRINGRPHSSRGKGMRAILHASLTVSLANYCFGKDLPHPGFVILDSPVVAYRGPAGRESAEEQAEEMLSPSVAGNLYRYMDVDFPGQAIVIENVDPNVKIGDGVVDYEFTRADGIGRYGFFPQRVRGSVD
ncbi:hypothetical protein ACIQPT_07085 [Streptomyces sp. NPDC091289]|uniref:hypothetical protein n=1 Tax=Streptomyces sp. NPDC091289 TaxID=3365989 RepID=UPI0037FB85C0